jgi:chromatin remodeling complex protein RSC6
MKSVVVLQKAADKKNRKPRRVGGGEAVEGGAVKPRFGNPVGISPALAKFMGIPPDSMVHRNDATNFVHTYVITHNLRLETNKRIFVPDAALQSILSEDTAVPGTEIGYFNLQKFIKHNFHANK